MGTTLVLVTSFFCISLVVGAVLAFVWLCGLAGGAVMRQIVPEPMPDAPHRAGQLAALIRRTRVAAGLPPIN
ncbi:hypothetical protein [Acidovorax sp. Leaf160]|uniref:hypothetical protein n=1 Tax=Acidovorax sp. Leaf160 TaxID=1736280 RepID=UPI0006F7F9AA|nr:hypothetical protein [Acidovorax sp. Leaf160]KQR50143.1 hypothetical protein ASF94_06565 [Acidovorax sp. Leaf160]